MPERETWTRTSGPSSSDAGFEGTVHFPRQGDTHIPRSTHRVGETVPLEGADMLRSAWIYRLAVLAALALASGAGFKW